MKTAAIFLTTLMTAGAALAHPGHPEAAAGASHWLTTVDHLVIIALVGYGLGLALPGIRARFKRDE